MDSTCVVTGISDFKSDVTVRGNSFLNSSINVTGISYLNGGAQVTGDVQVTVETRLNTNADNDVAIIDSAGVDSMRINKPGDITLKKAGIVFTTSLVGSAGLYLNNLSNGTLALFKANMDVFFW